MARALIILDTGREYLVESDPGKVARLVRGRSQDFDLASGSGRVEIPARRVVAVEWDWRLQPPAEARVAQHKGEPMVPAPSGPKE